MAEIQIHEISGTATEFETLDYIALDETTANSRKMLASVLQALIRNDATDAQMGYVAGLTATDAELNILDGCTATFTKLNYLTGSVPGASAASSAVVLDENQDGLIGRDLAITRNLAVTGISVLGGKIAASAGLYMNSSNIDLDGNDLILDGDGDSKLAENATTDDVIDLYLGGVNEYRWDAAAFGCSTAGANNLGGALSGASSAIAANAWNDLNLAGHISMGGIETPSNPAIDESMKIYFDSSDGGLKVLLRHGNVTKPYTLQAFA